MQTTPQTDLDEIPAEDQERRALPAGLGSRHRAGAVLHRLHAHQGKPLHVVQQHDQHPARHVHHHCVRHRRYGYHGAGRLLICLPVRWQAARPMCS